MRCLNRNKQPFYYCLYQSKIPVVDEYGNESGENIVTYASEAKMYANISQATGQSNTEIFGNLENYDKVIVTSDMNCPIDENTVLFIDKAPSYVSVSVNSETVDIPVYDYTVRRVAKSLNSIAIAVKRVEVT